MSRLLLYRLDDYGPKYRQYSLDQVSGKYDVTTFATGHDARRGTVGCAQVRRLGLWNAPKALVALFTDGKTLLLRVGPDVFDLRDPVKVFRSRVAPCIKSFVVSKGTQELVRLKYWHRDVHSWPDDDMLDIFLLARVKVETPRELKRSVYIWNATREGLVSFSQEFVEELEARLDAEFA